MIRRRCWALGILVALSGCTSPNDPERAAPLDPATVRTPSGATITLPIRTAFEHQADGTREQFRTEDGTVWSVQTIDPTATGAGQSIEEVAVALCHRLELGERSGELTHRACTFAGQPAQCVDGWQTGRDGDRITRRGAILRAANDIVWVSVAVREGTVAVDALAESLATETELRAP